jgi:purine-binding chemotaxis protein CheW
METSVRTVPCVVLETAGHRCALPMTDVAEVGRLGTVTRIPGLPGWVPGVTTWRGRVLAVVDLAPLLDATAGAGGPRVVVIDVAGVEVGLRCTGVVGVLELDRDEVQPVPAGTGGQAEGLLAGHVVDETGPVVILDAERVVGLHARLSAAL